MVDLFRCVWANRVPILTKYHDQEWGVPIYDDLLLFEFLILEGAQAGLSWLTILKKREGMRLAFDRFDPPLMARYGERKIRELLANPGIIRNRAKVQSAILNARAFLQLKERTGSFGRYVWQFVDGKPIQNGWVSMDELPSRTEVSDTMSKDLKQRGFSFVGSTICYSFMQAVGMVNDHLIRCFRHKIVAEWPG